MSSEGAGKARDTHQIYLRCSEPTCHTRLETHGRAMACPKCGELLEFAVEGKPDVAALKRIWRERRMTWNSDPRDSSGVWRFREFLPGDYSAAEVVTMGEGNVVLVQGHRTSGFAGVSNLRFKHLGFNPTACFKDLGMTVGITEAKYLGAKAVGCASTGNTAGSMAAYAARAGIAARVYLPAGNVSLNKLAQSLDYGAKVIQIEGNFDDALKQMLALGDPSLYFLNSINPFRIEGQKTVMFELMEQLDWQAPDYVVLPGGNLGNSSAFTKGLIEMHEAGLIDRVPRLIVVQASGANPFAKLWASGIDELHAQSDPETVATAIRIGNPKSWKKALRGVRYTNGAVIDVTDVEIGEAKTEIGRDGIGCEPASAATLAGVRKLVREGKMDKDASIVCVLTGHVLKDTAYVIQQHQAAMREMAIVDAH
jgi:threonine synthase